jgi:Ulp1 family protease
LNIDLRRSDLQTLDPTSKPWRPPARNGWLNDEVVNCYMELIVDRARQNPELPKVQND